MDEVRVHSRGQYLSLRIWFFTVLCVLEAFRWPAKGVSTETVEKTETLPMSLFT